MRLSQITFEISVVQPLQDRIVHRGNSRRFNPETMGDAPEAVRLFDSPATHEIISHTKIEAIVFVDDHGHHRLPNMPKSLPYFGRGNELDVKAPNIFHLMSPTLMTNPEIGVVGYMNDPSPTNRPKNSKFIIVGGTVYFVMVWTDLFGYSIKDSELCIKRAATRTNPARKTRYVRQATVEEQRHVMEALALFIDPIAPPIRTPHLCFNNQTVQQIALGIAQQHETHATILADALEDAGCADNGILNHCRNGLPHGPHCWVVRQALESTLLTPA
jgi:hypothetical protein